VRRSKGAPVRAGGRRAATSASGRCRASRHRAGSGCVTAAAKGPDLGGTDPVAPSLTRCHECHDIGPPSSPPHAMSNISLDRPKYFEIASRCRALSTRRHEAISQHPLSRRLTICGTNLERNRTKLSRSHHRWVRILAVSRYIAGGPAMKLS
jgi:hypothetical protein